jgi:dTDP-4-dehydrorhamnose 3,5-epimerase
MARRRSALPAARAGEPDDPVDPATPEPSAIAGVRVRRLVGHRDERGRLVELHRDEWLPESRFVQWNHLASAAGVLRGVHVHRRHCDLLFVLDGRMRLGLKDLRPRSPSHLAEQVVELDGADPRGVVIPAGVAHGFYFHAATLNLYGVDAYYDPVDELCCRWDDPGIGLFRDLRSPRLSPRDATAQSLDALVAQLAAGEA